MTSKEEIPQFKPERQFEPHHIHLGKLRIFVQRIDDPIKIDMPGAREDIQEDKENPSQE